MTTLRELTQLIFSEIPEATNEQLAQIFGSSANYMSRITHFLFDIDQLDRYRDGRSWVYFPNKDIPTDLYKEFTYTFRVLGTNKKDPSKHAWETDQTLDSTIKGLVPINFTEEMVKNKIHNDLFDTTRQILNDKGILMTHKFDGSVALEDDEIITGDGLDGIAGVEFGKTTGNYDPRVEFEIVYTNKEGITYDKKNGMGGYAQKEISDWF